MHSIVRMSIVANMKASINDCMPKRDACVEGSRTMLTYLNEASAYRRPGASISDFLNHGAGRDGVFLSIERGSRRITSVALASAPAMDKDLYYFSPVLSSLIHFRQSVHEFSLRDAAGILAMLKLLSNIEVLVNVLRSGDLSDRWAGRWQRPGGLPALIIDLIRERTGGLNITGGNVRRFQPFISNTEEGLPPRYLADLVDTIVAMAVESREKDWTNADEKDIAAEYERSCMTLGKVTKSGKARSPKECAFTLTNQHCVKVLYLTGVVLPLACSLHVRIPSTSTNQKKQKNRALVYFSQHSSGSLFEASQKFQDCVGSYVEQVYRNSGRPYAITQPVFENATCECYRSDKFRARDLVFIGQYFAAYNHHLQCLDLYQGSYNDQTRIFEALHRGPFLGLAFTDLGSGIGEHVRHGPNIALNLHCDITGQEGAELARESQIVLTSDMIGEVAIHEIKALCMQSALSVKTVMEKISAIFEVKAAIFGRNFTPRKLPDPHRDALVASLNWNNAVDQALLRALEQFPPYKDLLQQPRRTSRKARTPTPPTPRTQGTVATRTARVTRQGAGVTVTPEKKSRWGDKESSQRRVNWGHPIASTRTIEATQWSPPEDPFYDLDDIEPAFPFGQPMPIHNLESNQVELEQPWIPVDVFDVDSEEYQIARVSPPAPSSTSMKRPHTPGLEERRAKILKRITTASSTQRSGPRVFNVDSEAEEAMDAREALTHLSRPRQRERLPSVQVDGEMRPIDWSARNLDRIGNPVRRGNVLRRYYKGLIQKAYISGREFRGFRGTRDLKQSSYGVIRAGTLFDLARNAINSVPPDWEPLQPGTCSLPTQWSPADFLFAKYPQPGSGSPLYVCRSIKTPELVFNRHGECSICDDIAHFYGGRKFHDGVRMWWGFDSEEIARVFYLLCAVVTCGSSFFYHRLHNSSRRKFRAFSKQIGSLKVRKKGNESEVEECSPNYVVAYSPLQEGKCPYFMVTGAMGDGTTNASAPVLQNDFCIAIPSPSHWEQSGQKRGGRKDPGPAIFIRPLLSDRCLHLGIQQASKKKPPSLQTRGLL